MAPTITAAMSHSQEHHTLSHKLRKPLVEKQRRERINSSIEQLKSLLGPEFLKQQPDSKLEKADILEMTVCFLRSLQHQHGALSSAAVDHGYSRCVQEMVNFMSKQEVKPQTQRRMLNHFNNLRDADFSALSSSIQTNNKKEKSPGCSALWRPW
uniref:Transcription factor HES-5 n=2 Tax=Gouania willdenowi TaxID=441366 RepID=A0A8C5D4L4_GOUWI